MSRYILILTLFVILAGACAQKSESLANADETSAVPGVDEKNVTQKQLSQTPSDDLYSDGRTKLIKKANYRFEAADVKKSTEAIILAIKKYPAYISSSSLHLENPILENKITIRVQNEYFHELLQEIDLQARFVNYRDITTADVSKDFVDLESRLKTKREVEARYMQILRQKAGTIEELLDAEREIGHLHEEIEATISRINHLREQVSYSTINLELYQTISQEIARQEAGTATKFTDAFASGWNAVVTTSIALAHFWPLLLIALGGWGFIWRRSLKRVV